MRPPLTDVRPSRPEQSVRAGPDRPVRRARSAPKRRAAAPDTLSLIPILMFIVQKFGLIKNIPLFLQKNMAAYQRKTDIDSTKKFNQIYMGINCSWYPEYDHGGPILDISIMQELSQLNIQINFDIYFTYDISTILAFQKAAEKLGVGKNLNNHDWIDILIYIKKIYNIPPSTLGTVCENGDFLDDEGMLICSLREFVS